MSAVAQFQQKETKISYRPTPTGKAFHASDALVRGIMGPVGSGKTVMGLTEIWFRSLEQAPGNDGIRRSRWAVIRNTYPELKSTTIKSFNEFFPEEVAPLKWDTPITATIRANLPDGTTLEAEVIFLALDRPGAIKKLKSLELTGAFVNEAVEIPKAVIDMLIARIGRYPAKRSGAPITFSGVWMDTNPPDDDHWWYKIAEEGEGFEDFPEDERWEFFRQPSALLKKGGRYVPNPKAENVENQPLGYKYWLRQIINKSDEWIRVYILGQYGSIWDGKPIYAAEWNETIHVAVDEMWPIKKLPVFLSFDFGLTPACLFAQFTKFGQLRVIDELCAEDIGLESFLDQLVIPKIAEKYGENELVCIGDPSGKNRAETDERSAYTVLEERGLPCIEAPSNDPMRRWNAVKWFLNRLSGGRPIFVINRDCNMLRKGFNGGYRLRRIQVAGEERYASFADKNAYSHPHDSLQYLCDYIKSVIMRGHKPPVIPPHRPLDSVVGY